MSPTCRVRAVHSYAFLVVPLMAAAACSGGGRPLSALPYDAAGQVTVAGVADGGKLDPERPLEVIAKGTGGRITEVTVTDAAGRYLRGEVAEGGKRWRSISPLAAGTRYTMYIGTENKEGAAGRGVLAFDTAPASALLRISFGPAGGTYGVGQPVTAELSHPVKDRAARGVVERALKVTSQPRVDGAWYWVDDTTLHYRPRVYWPAGARIEVRSELSGLRVGKGLYGGSAEPVKLRIGDRIEAITDAASHRMTVKRSGKVLRTIPVTTGKPGFLTRNGIKIVLAKEPSVRMRSSTVGIAAGSSDSYDLEVRWAARVTWSGEYVHAAPWSVSAHGVANVSHGCTGMSMENAKWFFDTVHVGDIVQVVNSSGEVMPVFGNGFGDWNLSWKEWRKGSALTSLGGGAGSSPEGMSQLRPGR